MADFMAGALAAISVLAGLVSGDGEAWGVEVSLLGAALSLQAQRFVDASEDRIAATRPLDSDGLDRPARSLAQSERLDPYYRVHLCGDGGFVAVACLNTPQRRAVCSLFGLEDPFVEDPQAPAADAAELASRLRHASRIEQGFGELTLSQAVSGLAELDVPAAEVRSLEQLFADPQANANGLVQTVEQRIGRVYLLGNVFKVDGRAEPARRGAPELDEHRAELLETERWPASLRVAPYCPPMSEAHDRVERLAGAVYGTIVVAGVLAATEYEDEPEAFQTGVYALATVVVFWLAHAWAQTLGRRVVGAAPWGRSLRHSLARDWPLVESALAPLAAMAAALLFGASDETAIDVGFWMCVASLGAWGAIVAHREQASRARTAMTALGCAALGLLLVGLKELVS